MSDHDDFLDEYIEYRIFEESMKESGGKRVFSVRAEVISKGQHRPFLTRVRTALRHILRVQRVPSQASLLTPQRAKRNPQLFSQPQRKQRIKATPQNPNRAIPRMNSALKIMLTQMISTMITMMISMITRTQRIIITSTRINKFFLRSS